MLANDRRLLLVIADDIGIGPNTTTGILQLASHGIATGSGLELRFMAANAEIQNGDRLVTSGIDGTYPPGLPVGLVERIERDAEHSFARVLVVCKPAAGVDRGRYVLVLVNESKAPPRPDDVSKDRRAEKVRRTKGKDTGKDSAKDAAKDSKDGDGTR